MKKLLACCILAVFFGSSFGVEGATMCQWKQVLPFTTAQWGEIHDLVYFLDQVGHPEIGFASFWNATFRTSDGGNTWQEVLDGVANNGPLVDLAFKDSLTGWSASGLMTTDGGLTWNGMNLPTDLPSINYYWPTGIHYDSSTNRLFQSYWEFGCIVSTDEGQTWNVFSHDPLNGYAFVDDMHGIASMTRYGIVGTSDGGITWTIDFPDPSGCWQTFAQKGTSTFCYVSEYDNNFWRSTDYGVTWSMVSNLPQYQTGCLKQDDCGNFYSQGSTYLFDSTTSSSYFMFVSSDNGATWNSIGGPSNYADTRFYIVGSKVFAQDDNPNTSGLWVYTRPSGTSITPLLTGVNNGDTIHTKPGDDVTVALMLSSNSTNLLGLDSIRFEISFDSGMLSFDSSIAASGWTLHDSELSQGNWEYTLTIDSANIQFPLTLALLHFTAYLSKDSVSDISLSSFEGTLNTNQFSGCSELSIQSGNSVTVIAEDTCGDKILRQFMQSGTVPLAIQSIVPNPASGVVGINFIAPTGAAISYQVFDELGTVRAEGVASDNALTLDVHSLANGLYYLRARDAVTGFTASGRFVVER